jgi:hypothetical protein
MACFLTKNPNLGKFWRVLQWKILVYFMTFWSTNFTAIGNNLWPYFVVIWCISPRFGTKIWQPWIPFEVVSKSSDRNPPSVDLHNKGQNFSPSCQEIVAERQSQTNSSEFFLKMGLGGNFEPMLQLVPT